MSDLRKFIKNDYWTKQTKGNVKIYLHPDVERAIVVNHYGIFYNGIKYESLELAKQIALGTVSKDVIIKFTASVVQ